MVLGPGVPDVDGDVPGRLTYPTAGKGPRLPAYARGAGPSAVRMPGIAIRMPLGGGPPPQGRGSARRAGPPSTKRKTAPGPPCRAPSAALEGKPPRAGGGDSGGPAGSGHYPGARRSALGARRSALGARRSALGARRSALGANCNVVMPDGCGPVNAMVSRYPANRLPPRHIAQPDGPCQRPESRGCGPDNVTEGE